MKKKILLTLLFAIGSTTHAMHNGAPTAVENASAPTQEGANATQMGVQELTLEVQNLMNSPGLGTVENFNTVLEKLALSMHGLSLEDKIKIYQLQNEFITFLKNNAKAKASPAISKKIYQIQEDYEEFITILEKLALSMHGLSLEDKIKIYKLQNEFITFLNNHPYAKISREISKKIKETQQDSEELLLSTFERAIADAKCQEELITVMCEVTGQGINGEVFRDRVARFYYYRLKIFMIKKTDSLLINDLEAFNTSKTIIQSLKTDNKCTRAILQMHETISHKLREDFKACLQNKAQEQELIDFCCLPQNDKNQLTDMLDEALYHSENPDEFEHVIKVLSRLKGKEKEFLTYTQFYAAFAFQMSRANSLDDLEKFLSIQEEYSRLVTKPFTDHINLRNGLSAVFKKIFDSLPIEKEEQALYNFNRFKNLRYKYLGKGWLIPALCVSDEELGAKENQIKESHGGTTTHTVNWPDVKKR